MESSIRNAYTLDNTVDLETVRPGFFRLVERWLAGDTFAEIATVTGLDVDDVLRILTGVVTYGLQTVVEQAIALLAKMVEAQERSLGPGILSLPGCLRFGVPTSAASVLASNGIRHRRAAIALAATTEVVSVVGMTRLTLLGVILEVLVADEPGWRTRLGTLVYRNTIDDAS